MPTLNAPLVTGLPLDSGNSLHGLAGTDAVIAYTLFGVEASRDVYVNKVLAQGLLGTGDALLYVAPSGKSSAVSQLILSNTSGTAVAGVALAINGLATAVGNLIVSSLTIPAYGTAIFTDGTLRVYDATGNLYQTATAPFDATIPAITTPLALGTVGTAATAPHRDHTHQSPGGIAAIVAASAAIAATQTQVVGATIPAGLLRVGTVLRFRCFAFITSTVDNIITFRVRLGPTTLTGNIPASLAAHPGNSGTVTAAGVAIEVMVTIRTAGASGTCYGTGFALSVSTGAAVTQGLANASDLFTPASVAVDTTVDNIAEFTAVTAAATTTVTFQSAVIEVVKM